MAQSRRRRGRRLTRTTSPTHIPILTKNLLQTDKSLNIQNRELAFRQLTEQLWAAGLPSAKTACSMSVRSRCSSAPPSERGGDEEMKKVGWNNGFHDEEENIDWDQPDKPDDGNDSPNENSYSFTFRYFTYTRTQVASILLLISLASLALYTLRGR